MPTLSIDHQIPTIFHELRTFKNLEKGRKNLTPPKIAFQIEKRTRKLGVFVHHHDSSWTSQTLANNERFGQIDDIFCD